RRIHRPTVTADLEVQVGPGGEPTRAHAGDLLAGADDFAAPHEGREQVAVEGSESAAVVDEDVQSVAARTPEHLRPAPGRGADLRARWRSQVEAAVEMPARALRVCRLQEHPR